MTISCGYLFMKNDIYNFYSNTFSHNYGLIPYIINLNEVFQLLNKLYLKTLNKE